MRNVPIRLGFGSYFWRISGSDFAATCMLLRTFQASTGVVKSARRRKYHPDRNLLQNAEPTSTASPGAKPHSTRETMRFRGLRKKNAESHPSVVRFLEEFARQRTEPKWGTPPEQEGEPRFFSIVRAGGRQSRIVPLASLEARLDTTRREVEMYLELFAQFGRQNNNANDQAMQAGMVVGIILAVIVCFSIPISVGAKRGHPIIGLLGSICTIPAAILLGCLGGLPVAAVFVVIILVMGDGNAPTKRRRKVEYDDYDDDEDDRPRRRKRKKRKEYDDDDDDDDDDEDDDDRPRRRREID